MTKRRSNQEWLKSNWFRINPANKAILLISFVVASALAQAASVLSPETQKAVAEFKKTHPELKDEFMPFEQDCIDGKRTDKQCEENVKSNLADLIDEARANERIARANERIARADERIAQLNAKEAQVNVESKMVDHTTIFTVVLQLNNSIQYGNPDRSGIKAIGRINRPELQRDIEFMRSVDAKLSQNTRISQREIATLQSILTNNSQAALDIFNTLSPEKQKRFSDTKNMALGALKYRIKSE